MGPFCSGGRTAAALEELQEGRKHKWGLVETTTIELACSLEIKELVLLHLYCAQVLISSNNAGTKQDHCDQTKLIIEHSRSYWAAVF